MTDTTPLDRSIRTVNAAKERGITHIGAADALPILNAAYPEGGGPREDKQSTRRQQFRVEDVLAAIKRIETPQGSKKKAARSRAASDDVTTEGTTDDGRNSND